MHKTSDELFKGRQSQRDHLLSLLSLLNLLLFKAWLGWRRGRRGESTVRLFTDDNNGCRLACDIRHHVDRDALVHKMEKVWIMCRGGKKASTVTTIREGGRAGGRTGT